MRSFGEGGGRESDMEEKKKEDLTRGDEAPADPPGLARKIVLRQTCILARGEPVWRRQTAAPGVPPTIPRGWEVRMGRRVTFRVPNATYELLQKRCGGMGCDVSFVVRQALEAFLNGDMGNGKGRGSPGGHLMPAEAFAQTGPYRAWSGDLRVEVKRQFTQLLAASHTCAQHWPKTPGVRESHAGLLELCPLFGLK